ncbi:MAG: Demethylmenaquinone methyltransferase [Syntrophorhabdus sp. PtaU1.Bin153]|nr:MAG: Demethylmenaquinone methyltransferase [Syntrophorhabdus sp. PtaU1.Bin153]
MDEHLAKRLYEGVRRTYSAVAEKPSEWHPFPVGRDFVESLGYPKALLQTLPALSVDAFAGLSNVSLYAEIPEGSTVLDLGCGAGLDTFIAARRTGPNGRVIGIDFSRSMVDRALRALKETGLANIEFCEAPAEHLPSRNGEIDVAIINGIFNLNPNREAIFAELARVVRQNGHVYASELILIKPVANPAPSAEDDWFA